MNKIRNKRNIGGLGGLGVGSEVKGRTGLNKHILSHIQLYVHNYMVHRGIYNGNMEMRVCTGSTARAKKAGRQNEEVMGEGKDIVCIKEC